jgi:hypothetical protein
MQTMDIRKNPLSVLGGRLENPGTPQPLELANIATIRCYFIILTSTFMQVD